MENGTWEETNDRNHSMCGGTGSREEWGLLLRSEYEKKHFVTDQYEIESPKLPDGAAFRCVFLSDLHDNVYGTDNEPLVAAIRRFKPDAVLIGGDMMVCKGKGDLTVTVSLLEKKKIDLLCAGLLCERKS